MKNLNEKIENAFNELNENIKISNIKWTNDKLESLFKLTDSEWGNIKIHNFKFTKVKDNEAIGAVVLESNKECHIVEFSFKLNIDLDDMPFDGPFASPKEAIQVLNKEFK